MHWGLEPGDPSGLTQVGTKGWAFKPPQQIVTGWGPPRRGEWPERGGFLQLGQPTKGACPEAVCHGGSCWRSKPIIPAVALRCVTTPATPTTQRQTGVVLQSSPQHFAPHSDAAPWELCDTRPRTSQSAREPTALSGGVSKRQMGVGGLPAL